ncbi:MAG: GntR family transcriptional regulator [Candidatus Xenobia bacterium]
MREDLPLVLPETSQPVYLRLAQAIRAALSQGQLQPGELLPSTRGLAQRFQLHRHTVMNALDELVAEGWLRSEPGRGYRAAAVPPSRFLEVRQETPTTAKEPGFRLVRTVAGRESLPELEYRFPSGQPDLRLFPWSEFYRHAREVLRRRSPERLLGYGDPTGRAALKEQLWAHLRRLRGLTEGELVITHGSQEAIYILGQLLVEKGETVAVEELGYPPAWQALRAAGARLEGLTLDAQGLDPEAFRKLCRRGKVRLLYLTPLHQYPTTVTLPRDRRQALYELADRYGVPILEDDYDHEFHYRCQPVAPLKASDPTGLVLYCSTFSKVLFPAARLGFAVVPPRLAREMGQLKRVISRQNDHLMQETVALWMRTQGFERHLRRMRRVYHARMLSMLQALQDYAPARPDGGMCLWVNLGVDADALAEAAARRQVAVMPESAFRLDHGPSRHLRLGFASSSPEEIAQGMARLISASFECPRLS